jgi:hypothetical protein
MSTPLVRDTLATLEKNVDRAEALVADLSDEQLSWKPAPDVFSVRENIWHMRDIDFDGYLLRVEQTLTKRKPSTRLKPRNMIRVCLLPFVSPGSSVSQSNQSLNLVLRIRTTGLFACSDRGRPRVSRCSGACPTELSVSEFPVQVGAQSHLKLETLKLEN